jgi:hypothetical protein
VAGAADESAGGAGGIGRAGVVEGKQKKGVGGGFKNSWGFISAIISSVSVNSMRAVSKKRE